MVWKHLTENKKQPSHFSEMNNKACKKGEKKQFFSRISSPSDSLSNNISCSCHVHSSYVYIYIFSLNEKRRFLFTIYCRYTYNSRPATLSTTVCLWLCLIHLHQCLLHDVKQVHLLSIHLHALCERAFVTCMYNRVHFVLSRFVFSLVCACVCVCVPAFISCYMHANSPWVLPQASLKTIFFVLFPPHQTACNLEAHPREIHGTTDFKKNVVPLFYAGC